MKAQFKQLGITGGNESLHTFITGYLSSISAKLRKQGRAQKAMVLRYHPKCHASAEAGQAEVGNK